MHATQEVTKVLISEIRTDLKEHMMRTSQNEAMIEAYKEHTQVQFNSVNKNIWMVKGAMSLIGLAAVVFSVLEKLGKI